MRTRPRADARLDHDASPPAPRLPRSTRLRALFAALVLFVPWTVTAQRFDVVTFDPPPGWTQKGLTDGLMFETYLFGTRSGCQILLSKSRAPTASLPQELERTWSELAEGQPLTASTPDPDQLDLPSGFTVAQRVGQVQTSGGTLVVMLNLLQKDDRLVPVVVSITDTQALDFCGAAIEDFVASLRLGDAPAATGAPVTDPGSANPAEPLPRPNPELAARFGNSVVGTWRYAMTSVNVTLNAPTQVRNAIDVRFARDGTYSIAVNMSIPGAGGYSEDEAGTYQVEGQRILMRPARGAGKEPYDLDWFFGDHPEYVGNWGLILRSSGEWLGTFGGLSGRWRTFKPVE